ncbi:MAG: hypothetical protein ACO4CZ_09255, partial [Planctomycetota bacterium]
RTAIEHSCELEDLPTEVLTELMPEIPAASLRRELSVDRVLARRKVAGGTAPSRVRAEVKAWQKKLGPTKTARSKR